MSGANAMAGGQQVDEGMLSRGLGRFEHACVALAGLSIAVIMLVVVADVTMRYLIHRPLSWSYDLIGSYLMVAVFFLAISDTLQSHGHIAIDIFAPAFNRRIEHLGLGIGYGASAVLIAVIAWQGWHRLVQAQASGDLISATVPWPTWPTYALLALGSAAMALRCALRTLGHLGSAVAGRDLVGLPPRAETGEHAGEHGE
ncbi:TRAP transporter small permease [Frigidibacter sp. MR17.14]|uniref:TRAP transporter small permease n=1 Tax=Frigidibacter sp. MR17.14 TaxID=3126509 RepID=UPI003012A119